MTPLRNAIILFSILASITINAQIAINTDGSDADESAILDIKSTEKGVLLPRLTSIQITEIPDPADGLLVYCTTDGKLYIYVALESAWRIIEFASEELIMGNSCPDVPTIEFEGQTYNTVQIGAQCWFKENLNVGTRIYGNQISTDNSIIEKYCYMHDENYCNTYGGLYQWNELMQYNIEEGAQGICPDGWHIPTDDEWKILEMYLGMSENDANNNGFRGTNEGEKMKASSGWDNLGNGTNISGFNAIPGGMSYGGSYNFWGNRSFWWTSTSPINLFSRYRSLTHDNARVYRQLIENYAEDDLYGYQGNAYSVRCIKD